jgi:predicted transcriptional regulator
MADFRSSDRPTLVALLDYDERHKAGRVHWPWARPMDLGKSSVPGGHATTLTRLIKLGLVERRQRNDTGRPSAMTVWRAHWEYRISPAGRALVSLASDANHRFLEREKI